jgi:hypothetical protein
MGASGMSSRAPYVKFVLYLLATLILLALGTVIGLSFCENSDDDKVAATGGTAFQCSFMGQTSPTSNPYVCRDSDTGCEYIMTSRGITPRLRADGTPWCDGGIE